MLEGSQVTMQEKHVSRMMPAVYELPDTAGAGTPIASSPQPCQRSSARAITTRWIWLVPS